MTLTISEFLHPLNAASQKDLVLAAMYFLARYESRDAVTTSDIQAAFTRAKHTRGRRIQYASTLTRAAPFVEARGKDGRQILWTLTGTGQARVRELLNLPDREPEVERDVSTLQALSATIGDQTVRGYVDEAVTCLQVGALRAGIVFLWTGATETLRDRVWTHGASTIDDALKRHNPKGREFKKRSDFAYVNDKSLLQIAEDLEVLDKTAKGILGEALNLRNYCGHPTTYKPGEKKASAFIEDVVGIIWK